MAKTPPKDAPVVDASAPVVDPQAIVKVRATKLGYSGDKRRRPGDVFRVPQRLFSSKWMERVSPDTPERSVSPADFARQQQAQLHVPKINPIGHTLEADDEDVKASGPADESVI